MPSQVWQGPKKILEILPSIAKLEKTSDLIKDLLHSGELFHPYLLYFEEEAYQFLAELEIYEEAGVKCRFLDWWTKSIRASSLSIRVEDQARFGKDASEAPASLYHWRLGHIL